MHSRIDLFKAVKWKKQSKEEHDKYTHSTLTP